MANGDTEAFTLMSLGLFFIIVRIYVRWSQVGGPLNFAVDDYLMPLAGAVFIGETVAAHLVRSKFNGLTNSYMTDEQRATVDPSSKEYYDRQWGSKIQVIGWSLYAMILWLIKFCVAIYYSRLTSGLNNLPARVRFAYILLGVTYLLVGLTIVLGCQPMHKNWQINPNPGNICQPTKSTLSVLIVVIPNVITDLYLMSIPLPLLWAVKISIRQKLTLMALFSSAAFIIMAGIIRAVTILTAGPDGAVAGSQWACRETFVSIVVANLPIIQPLLRKGASKIGLSVLFSSARGGTGSYGRRRGESYPLASREGNTQTATKKSRTRLSVHEGTITAGYGSDEEGLVGTGKKGKMRDITVTQETVIETEPAGKEPEGTGRFDWGRRE
ncbi:uncharacterized protein AKAW2_10097A [Aspergillus luchuensis]|uniref:Srpk n=1 Tax=Aspergillus kawachii TaxID=1069201 RepID=A0A146FB59_ASPKA|nr:uncharacterized protein AKAW2_10097A [Aspergillus luchuensis]BCR93051.1 hypothetical protein AKAW2_10097A [Aspergillus luchuensis]BCS05709.1 hypothetical protein ALUC_10090A [Aspergillus luchuensis]GAA86941.1 srpk [Aspergillus luchuensis IFO 4308]GAT22922.1 srpk [Aspergillus luchuensis]